MIYKASDKSDYYKIETQPNGDIVAVKQFISLNYPSSLLPVRDESGYWVPSADSIASRGEESANDVFSISVADIGNGIAWVPRKKKPAELICLVCKQLASNKTCLHKAGNIFEVGSTQILPK